MCFIIVEAAELLLADRLILEPTPSVSVPKVLPLVLLAETVLPSPIRASSRAALVAVVVGMPLSQLPAVPHDPLAAVKVVSAVGGVVWAAAAGAGRGATGCGAKRHHAGR